MDKTLKKVWLLLLGIGNCSSKKSMTNETQMWFFKKTQQIGMKKKMPEIQQFARKYHNAAALEKMRHEESFTDQWICKYELAIIFAVQ